MQQTSHVPSPNPARPELRFGVACGSRQLPAWATECIKAILAGRHARLVVLIQDAGSTSAPPGAGNDRVYRWYQRRWVERRSRALQPVSLESVPDFAQLDRVSAAEFERLAGYGLDFVLHFGEGRPSDELVKLPRFGVWSYTHGERGALGFWELATGAARTECKLVRLLDNGRPPLVLQRGSFGTCKASWVNNIDRALFGSADWGARVCAQLWGGDSSAHELAVSSVRQHERAPAERAPADSDLARVLQNSGVHAARKLWELLFHTEIWHVGFTHKSLEQIVEERALGDVAVSWLKPHKPRNFIADPFSYHYAGKDHVLVEDYDVKGKGRICAVATDGESLELSVDMEFPYHLSYPCIFTEDGETYCIPEAYQSQKASLYRRGEGGWELVRHLIEGLPVVDPTLFRHGGRYWLLFTLQNDGAWGNLKLHAYHADSLDGEFTPHLLNPIKCEIGSTRPAGSPFVVNGELYRPSQDCSETYGGALVLNRITRLSPTEFEEEAVARLEPRATWPYPHGLHTINRFGKATLLDAKKFQFDLLAWRHNWGRLHEVFK